MCLVKFLMEVPSAPSFNPFLNMGMLEGVSLNGFLITDYVVLRDNVLFHSKEALLESRNDYWGVRHPVPDEGVSVYTVCACFESFEAAKAVLEGGTDWEVSSGILLSPLGMRFAPAHPSKEARPIS